MIDERVNAAHLEPLAKVGHSDLELVQLRIADDSPSKSRRIADIQLPRGSVIVARRWWADVSMRIVMLMLLGALVRRDYVLDPSTVEHVRHESAPRRRIAALAEVMRR